MNRGLIAIRFDTYEKVKIIAEAKNKSMTEYATEILDVAVHKDLVECMDQIIESQNVNKKALFLTVPEASKEFGIGLTNIRKIAKECKAEKKIGHKIRIDREVMDQYLHES